MTGQSGAYVNKTYLVMSYHVMGVHPTALPWVFMGLESKDMLRVLGEDMSAEELPAKED